MVNLTQKPWLSRSIKRGRVTRSRSAPRPLQLRLQQLAAGNVHAAPLQRLPRTRLTTIRLLCSANPPLREEIRQYHKMLYLPNTSLYVIEIPMRSYIKDLKKKLLPVVSKVYNLFELPADEWEHLGITTTACDGNPG